MNYKDIILLTGEEIYLTDHFLDQVKSTWVSNMKEMNYHKIETIKNNVGEIINFMRTIAFMVEKKVLVIENCDFLTSKKGLSETDEKEFYDYLKNKTDENLIILNASKLKVDSRKKIFKLVTQRGSVIKYDRLSVNDLKTWILIYIEKHNRSIKDTDAYYLSQVSGYLDTESQMNLYDIKNELDKLIGYTNEHSTITRNEIDLLIKSSIEQNIFKLVDSISEGFSNRAFEMIRDMIENNIAPQYIFFMITRHFRLLMMIDILEREGKTQNNIIAMTGVKSFSMSKMLQQIKRLGSKKIAEIYHECYLFDRLSKKGHLDIEAGIEIIISKAKK
jgi:DNA polymerase III subunit delta